MSAKLKEEVALVAGALVAGGETLNILLLNPPTWVHVTIAVVIAMAGAAGVRSKVSPV